MCVLLEYQILAFSVPQLTRLRECFITSRPERQHVTSRVSSFATWVKALQYNPRLASTGFRLSVCIFLLYNKSIVPIHLQCRVVVLLLLLRKSKMYSIPLASSGNRHQSPRNASANSLLRGHQQPVSRSLPVLELEDNYATSQINLL